MTLNERNQKLKYYITCLKCGVSGKCCNEDCPTRYDAGNMGEIIENLEAISKVLEQDSKKGQWIRYGIPRCGEQHYKCTSCGYYINFGKWGEVYTKQFKFCPNCGARMESEEVWK